MANPRDEQADPWALRASDADREAYLAVLRESYAEGRLDAVEYEDRMTAALAAKTYRDLFAVLTELPFDPAKVTGPPLTGAAALASPGGRRVPVPVPGPYPVRPTGADQSTTVFAALSSAKRSGPWIVQPELTVVALLGEVTLDLTSAVLTSTDTVIRCNALMGSVNVIVPDAIDLHVEGSAFMGDFDYKDKRKRGDRARTPAPDAPRIRITGLALMGSVCVRLVVPKSGGGISMLDPAPHRPEITGGPPD